MTTYDAIVVGGGVVGMAAAWHLVREGARTLLLDRGDPGRASDAGAGILSSATGADHPEPVPRFAARAAAYYPGLIEQLRADGAGDSGYAMCGALTVAVAEDEVGKLERLRPAGAGPEGPVAISPERARQLFPPLAAVRGALHEPRRARVDGRLLTAALERAARARGLERRHGGVDRLLVERDAVRGVVTGGDEIAAGHVVIAAGAWSGALLRPLGVRLPVAPQRGQIVHLDLADQDTRGWPIVLAFRGHYLVPWDDRRVVAGATRETGSGFRPHTTVGGLIEVLREATRVAPGLRGAAVREIRVGLRPASPDGRPVLGPVPGVANLHLATGHGASGLQLGPYSGRVIAQLITQDGPDVDIGPFSMVRFAKAEERA
jgi:D-amino-acid dehydrogenase